MRSKAEEDREMLDGWNVEGWIGMDIHRGTVLSFRDLFPRWLFTRSNPPTAGFVGDGG